MERMVEEYNSDVMTLLNASFGRGYAHKRSDVMLHIIVLYSLVSGIIIAAVICFVLKIVGDKWCMFRRRGRRVGKPQALLGVPDLDMESPGDKLRDAHTQEQNLNVGLPVVEWDRKSV